MGAEGIWRESKDPVARLESGHAVAQPIDYPGKIHTERLHLRAQKPCHRPGKERVRPKCGGVGAVDRRRANPHQDFTRCRARDRHLPKRKRLRWAVSVEDYRLHHRCVGHTARLPDSFRFVGILTDWSSQHQILRRRGRAGTLMAMGFHRL